MKHIFVRYNFIIFIILNLTMIVGCKESKKKHFVGFSQCTMADVWRVQMLKEMNREIYLINDIDLELNLKDAQNSISKQKKDIRELVNKEVDILIISPLRSDPLKSLIDSIAQTGLPIILIDRHIKIESENVYYIGANNIEIGKKVAKEINEILPKGGNILQMAGLIGSRPALQRSNGFNEIMDNLKDFSINTLNCDWTEESAFIKMSEIIESKTKFDAIFSHNDFMAKGIVKAFKNLGESTPAIIGVDGLNTPGFGIDMVIDSSLTCTFTYPTGGDVAIQTAYKILTNKSIAKNLVLNSVLIDKNNVSTIKAQRDEIDAQIAKIDKQNKLLQNKELQLNIQNKEKRTIIISSALIITLMIITAFILKKRILQKKSTTKIKEYDYQFPIPVKDGANNDQTIFITNFQDIILNNLMNEKISLQFISDQLGMSHSTLYRKIKSITGLKGVELINLIRLQQAEKLLKTTSLSIKEIAFKTGFSTSSYFSTSFVKQFGITPSKFRE